MRQLAEALKDSSRLLRAAEDNVASKNISSTASEVRVYTPVHSVHKSSLLLDIRPIGSPARNGGWLKPLDLQVRRGEFWAIVGENGAGKTTLARHIMGLLPVRPGVIFIEGRDSSDYPFHELARRIGYVFQNPEHQFVTEQVSEEIAFGLKGIGLSEAEITAQVIHLLERFGLTTYADAHPYCLSHGQKRRLSVAVMLAIGQELLILDEPTFGTRSASCD
ncbi:putative HMP/thiamine import ATP-binding protein YkoD [compost metagenome]